MNLRELKKRQRIVIEAIRQGCERCPTKGMLCFDHEQVLLDLMLSPVKTLKKWERELFGTRHKRGGKHE